MNGRILTVGILSVFLMASVLALNPASYNGLNHQGKASQLYLYEKDSNWDIVEDGAWGKLTFSEESFVFNGHGLESGSEYTLLNDAEWGVPVECLDVGTPNKGGNLHLSGEGVLSGKIWLVLSDDVDCETGMIGWNPSEYLFEYNLI